MSSEPRFQSTVFESTKDSCLQSSALPAQSRDWYAAYTTPRHEKQIAQHLRTRQIEYFLPLYHADRRWKDGSRVSLELPLFPGYVFVRTLEPERFQVLGVPGVLAIVEGVGKKPAVLPETEIEALRSGLRARRAEPHPLLTVGHRARINCGPLAGLEGVIVRTKGGYRIVLTLDQIGKSIAVEVDSADLVLLHSPSDLQCG